MKIKIDSLTLKCKKDTINIPFSKSITYFYGKMGAGKSTIPQLIDFCLGNELIETPALQQEFISARLDLETENYYITLQREKRSNQIYAECIELQNKETFRVIAPVKAQEEKIIIPGTEIQNISDLLFYLSGFQPPRVRKSKIDEESDLVRLSFRNIMWYCYLDQDDIDSSFFHLEEGGNDYKKLFSRDVMRLILGYQQESIAQIESDLSKIRRQRYGILETARQLKLFLDENNIGDVASIQEKIEQKKIKLIEIKEERNIIRNSINRPNKHIVDKLRNKAQTIIVTLAELENASYEVNNQILQRKRLLGEFTMASIKMTRSYSAKIALKDIDFIKCPQCEKDIKGREVPLKHCSLCLQPIDDKSQQSIDIISTDLKARCNELQESIDRFEKQKRIIVNEIDKTMKKKSKLDTELTEAEHEYDSAYLALAKDLEKQIGENEAQQNELVNLMQLPMKISKLHDSANQLLIEEENLKRELSEARAIVEKEAGNLRTLQDLFLDCLVQVGFPGIHASDAVKIDTRNFFPNVYAIDNDIYNMNFLNLGSGGKKTIFKCCFALAIHRLAAKKNIPLPSFLLIDTPMKNISERENKDIFDGFYKFVYKLFSCELKETQLIIVDKEFYSFENYEGENEPIFRHMTPDDPEFPALIPYYFGH